MSDGRQTGNGRYVHDSQHESKLKSDLARIDNTARDVMGPNEWGDGSYHDARAFRSVVRLRGAILKLLNLVFNRRPCLLLLALRRSRQGSWHSRAERWRSGVHLVCHEYQRSEMAASAIMRELLPQLIDALLPPMRLHQAPASPNPPLYYRQQEQSDARPDHRTCILRNPALKPENIAERKVEIRLHCPACKVHGTIHAHVHTIRVCMGWS